MTKIIHYPITPKEPSYSGTEYQLVQPVFKRFPYVPATQFQNVAMNMQAIFTHSAMQEELTPIDWLWHRLLLRKSRQIAAQQRLLTRVDEEAVARYIHEQKVLRDIEAELERIKAARTVHEIKAKRC